MKFLFVLVVVNTIALIIAIVKTIKVKGENGNFNNISNNEDEQEPISSEIQFTPKLEKLIKFNEKTIKYFGTIVFIVNLLVPICRALIKAISIYELNLYSVMVVGNCVNIVISTIYILTSILSIYTTYIKKKDNNIKIYFIYFVMPIVLLTLNLTYNSYINYITVDNKKLNEFLYCKNVLEDCINQKTESVKINKNDIHAREITSVSRRGNRVTRNSGIISFSVNKNNKRYTYYSSDESVKFANYLRILTLVEDEVLIEYYSNSGIIKSVDNISKLDFEKLEARIQKLQKENNINDNSKNLDYTKHR